MLSVLLGAATALLVVAQARLLAAIAARATLGWCAARALGASELRL